MITFCNEAVTLIPPDATENEFPLATEMGAPVQEPNSHRTGDPASSHSSIPLIVHGDPDPFVHDRVDVFDEACPDATANVVTDPPVVYPVPDSSVMSTEAVGLLVPSRVLMPVVEAVVDCLRIAFNIAFACVASSAANAPRPFRYFE